MRENKNTHRGFKIFIIIFAIFILLFAKEENQQKAIDIFNSFRRTDKELKLNMEYEIGDNEQIYYLNESIAKYLDNTLIFINPDGSTLWNKEFSFIDPEVVLKDNTLYIMDKSTGDIYHLDNKGDTINRIQLKESLFNLREEENNILIHIKEDQEEKLKVLNMDGEELFSIYLENILTYTVYNDDYLVSNLRIEEGAITSVVNLISSEGDIVDEILFSNEIIIFSKTIDKRIIVLTDKSLNIIEDGNIIWSEDYPLIKDILVDRDKIYLLYGDNLETISFKGEIKEKVTFGIEYKKIRNLGGYIALYGVRDILLLQNGEEILKYKSEEDIENIYGNQNQIAFIYFKKLEVYDIINK